MTDRSFRFGIPVDERDADAHKHERGRAGRAERAVFMQQQGGEEDAADRVEQALDGLRQLRGDLERQVQELERRREELVEQA